MLVLKSCMYVIFFMIRKSVELVINKRRTLKSHVTEFKLVSQFAQLLCSADSKALCLTCSHQELNKCLSFPSSSCLS